MQTTILILHVLGAFAMWTSSLYGFELLRSGKMVHRQRLLKAQKIILLSTLFTVVFGLFVSLSLNSISVGACAKIAVYISPAIIAILALRQRIETSVKSKV